MILQVVRRYLLHVQGPLFCRACREAVCRSRLPSSIHTGWLSPRLFQESSVRPKGAPRQARQGTVGCLYGINRGIKSVAFVSVFGLFIVQGFSSGFGLSFEPIFA